jgi:hypothetical protein
VSDSELDQVVKLLREHCVAGRLTLDEFSERTGSTLVARTRGELDVVAKDLPSATNVTTGLVPRRARRWIVAVMSSSTAKGRWRLGDHTFALAVMGECTLDLSHAEISGPNAVITAVAIMGSIKIVVPEGIGVDLTGVSVMGEKSLRAHDVPTLTQSPTILVQGFPIMGEGKVKSRAPKNGPTT